MAITVEFSQFPRSILPPGGEPSDDRAYLAWRDAFVGEMNARWLDARTRPGRELPDREPIEAWRLDEFLFLETGGSRLFDSANYSHRLRHNAINFKAHRRTMIRLANQYAALRAAAIERAS